MREQTASKQEGKQGGRRQASVSDTRKASGQSGAVQWHGPKQGFGSRRVRAALPLLHANGADGARQSIVCDAGASEQAERANLTCQVRRERAREPARP